MQSALLGDEVQISIARDCTLVWREGLRLTGPRGTRQETENRRIGHEDDDRGGCLGDNGCLGRERRQRSGKPGTDPTKRLLTGFDFDPESLEIGRDGTFWIGDEFGPFLLHADRAGRLLDAPISDPGVKSPQNPTLNVLGGEKPTVASSRGFEDLAISPDRRRLYAVTEGAVGEDDPQDLRIVTFDIKRRQFTR